MNMPTPPGGAYAAPAASFRLELRPAPGVPGRPVELSLARGLDLDGQEVYAAYGPPGWLIPEPFTLQTPDGGELPAGVVIHLAHAPSAHGNVFAVPQQFQHTNN